MIDVKETLLRIRDNHRKSNKTPDYVLFAELSNDVMRQLREELNALYADNKISVGSTLNDKYIDLKF